MNGRPALEPDEEARIRARMDRFAERLRPTARALVASAGFLSAPGPDGRRTLAVSRGWCVFFHDGCVLERAGAEEGDRFRYKPWRCALFPLRRDPATGRWFVRQRGERGETWDLFCLDPRESEKRAHQTLRAELSHVRRLSEERRLPTPSREGGREPSRPA